MQTFTHPSGEKSTYPDDAKLVIDEDGFLHDAPPSNEILAMLTKRKPAMERD